MISEAPVTDSHPSIERVAEAIYESDRYARHNAEPWAVATTTTRTIYLRNAAAAIKAMEAVDGLLAAPATAAELTRAVAELRRAFLRMVDIMEDDKRRSMRAWGAGLVVLLALLLSGLAL